MFSPILFFFDLLCVSTASWLLVCGSSHAWHGNLEAIIAWIWTMIAIVAGSGMVLGITGGFGAAGFDAVHFLGLGAVAFWRRKHLRAALERFARLFNAGESMPRDARMVALFLTFVLASLCAIAIAAEPAVLDALNYHLPRAAHWLQDGRIHMLSSNDERLDYISSLPEVVMAWLLGPKNEGFRGVVLLQAIGGSLAMLATVGLGRISGLSQSASMLAGSLLLGMANVMSQFTSAQTDLFTAGVFAASFYLWVVALQRNEFSWPGALGAGLAIGAKGTLFYFVPSALLWIIWLSLKHRPNLSQWRQTLIAGIAGLALFAGPGMWRNWKTYGDPRGPGHWIEKFHPQLPSFTAKAEKLRLNVISAAAQNFEPQSQPIGLQTFGRVAGLKLTKLLPEHDPYTFLGQDRIDGLNRLLLRTSPDADTTSFGMIPMLLFLSGTALAISRIRQQQAVLILIWSSGIWLFFLDFNILHQWHPFSFRYYVLAAPWIAVVSSWCIEQTKGLWRKGIWSAVSICTLSIATRITFHTHQGGWQTVVHPERTLGSYVAQAWRNWSQNLAPIEASLTLDLPDNRPLAAFYRQHTNRKVQFISISDKTQATVEELVSGKKGWLIVPSARFLGREGRVGASVWLFEGDQNNPYSLAAYRALAPGETPNSFLYRQAWTTHHQNLRQELLVKSFDATTVRLRMKNPTAANSPFTWSTPLGHGNGVLLAGSTIELSLPIPANAVSEVQLQFLETFFSAQLRPIVTLIP
jgi:hypothetical protein